MTDETNAVSAAVAPPELKSTDTRVHVVAEAKPEPAKVEAVEVKPEPVSKDPEGVATDAPDADSPQKKEQRLPRWMKERLERVREVTEAETRAKVLEEVQKSAPKPEAAKVEKPEKTLEDFDYDQDAYFDWKVEQKLAQREQKQREAEEQKKLAEAQESFKSRVDAFEERVGAGAWEDIEASKLNRDPAYAGLAAMIRDEDFALDIAHHLATNPDKAESLVKLPPLKMALEVAKIAEQLTGQQPEKPAPVLPKKTTNAPPPPKTVSGSGKPSVDVNAPDLTPEQRIAMWRKKG
jgi:hypothetical protein